jgi:hypothetical protein
VDLLYWCRKLSAKPRKSDGTPPATFVPVRMAVEPEDVPAIEMVLSSGERLLVRTGASADLVRAVVMALRPPC